MVAEAMVSICKDTEDKLKGGDKPSLHGCEVEGQMLSTWGQGNTVEAHSWCQRSLIQARVFLNWPSLFGACMPKLQ